MNKKKKWFKRGILSSVGILLGSIFIPSTLVFAEVTDVPKKPFAESQPYLVDSQDTSTDDKPTEILSERTENEKVLDNHDGTFTKQIYQEPIYTTNEDTEQLEKIQPELTDNDINVSPVNVDIKTQFLKVMEQGLYQIVGKEKEMISFSFKGASEVSSLKKNSTQSNETNQEEIRGESITTAAIDKEIEITENEGLYKEVLPNVDFRQTVFNQSVKEDFILNTSNNYNTYYFELDTPLKPTVEETGEVTFKNDKGEIIYEIPRPVMTDSNFDEGLGSGEINESLNFEIFHLSGNIYQLALRVDLEWIQSDDRVFPIYIDPSITYNKLQDANARQANATVNYSGSSLWRPQLKAHTLWIGKYGDTQSNQAYFKADMSKINQATIQSAKFKAYNIWHSYDNKSNELSLNAVNQNWDPKKLTWNNKPSHTFISKTNVKKAQWANFDVTKLVQDWTTGKRANHGISLTTLNQDDHWKQVIAAENTNNVPYFEITYAYNKPAKPTVKGVAHNNQKTGHLEINWPKVAGATSYQVTISSGKEDIAFPVGNVTSFSTKGKGIYPTEQEIQDGATRFRTDGKGTDLALDPQPFYENVHNSGATSSLKGVSGYDVRVIAIYPGGNSPSSDFVRTYLPIGETKVPLAKAYSNISQEESGYVSLNWEEVPLADGYEVLVFNGKEYQTFDVGKKFSWTTQGKGIWPTKEEINSGKYLLHTDGKGTELAKDPRPVYKNADTKYATNMNYWFRIKAYRKDNKHEKSAWSAAAMPVLPESQADKLGMTDFGTSIPVRGGQVNALNGNLILTEEDFSISGRGNSINLVRTYNAFSQEIGLFGKGWISSFEDRLTEIPEKDEIHWIESDGKQNIFKKKGNMYEAPPGLFSEIKKDNNTYVKTEEDKSKTIYSKTGKLLKEIDKNNNTIEYSYNEKDNITKIKDASGREIQVSYQTNDLVDSIQLPNSKKISFSYDESGRLIESKSARAKTYGYGYNEQDQLISLFEPKHTKEKPQETQYIYEGKKLKEIIDPVQKKTQLTFDEKEHTTTLTNERGKKTTYHYSKAGNPEKIVEDSEGLKLTTSYQYESNNLIKEVNPKGQSETYTYDLDGNILTFTDGYGTERYEYNKNNDVISEIDTENQKTTIAYDGADALSETINNAETSSFASYDQYGNILKESASLGTGENLILNSGFETGTSQGWYTWYNYPGKKEDTKGSLAVSQIERASGSLSGKHALKIVSEASGQAKAATAAAQRFDVEPNTTYTLSADIKTTDMKDSQAFLDVWLIQADNTTGEGWRNNRETAIQGNSDWVRRQVTFTTTKNTRRIGIYLKNEQFEGKKGKGTVFFDNVQLERGGVHTGYNPVDNSGLEDAKGIKDINGFVLSGTQTNIGLSDESFTGSHSFQMTRKTPQEGNGYISQYVQLNQQKEAPITISALSKAENVKAGDGSSSHKDYSLWADIIYQDGTIEYKHEKFPTGTQDWNRAAISVLPTKPIKEVKLLFMFRNSMTGTAYFDNLRVMEGNRLNEKVYDSKGNYVVDQYDEERRKTSFTYDEVGNVLTQTDEKGQQKSFQYNEDNQLLVTRLANGTEVKYTYDDNGNIVKREILANGQAQTHSYQYDADDKTTHYVDPLNRQILYQYDASGNETNVKMPTGHEIKNEYDSADRQTKVSWANKAAYSFQYDPNGNQTKVIDHLNQLTVDKLYDDANRITNVIERGGSVSYEYKDKPSKDNKGKTDKVASVIVSKGSYTRKVNYEFDSLNQNTTVHDGDKKYIFDYDEFGNKTLYTAGNGTMTNSTFDQTNKLTEVAIGSPTQQQLLKERYTYDASSNRTSITHTDDKKTTYTYDKINQLTEEVLPTNEKRNYTYDGFGNRTSVSINGQTKTSTFNTGNQLTSFNGQELTYDVNGNRLSDDKFNYKWDEADRLVAVTKKGETNAFTAYTYDDDNRRLSKTVNGQTINYHYDGDSIDVLYETDNNNNVLRQYIYSDDNIRLAMKSGQQTVYYHYNGHGDVIALTDEQGKQVAIYSYDAWGNVLKSEATTTIAKSNPYGYAGYTYDAEIQQYYLMARYYHPEHGVFTSIDPDPGDDDDPLTMNGYAYADNNPVMKIDPDGHFAIAAGWGIYISAKVIGTGIAMAAGAYVGYRMAQKRPYKSNASKAKKGKTNWGHIKKGHGPKSKEPNKGKFRSNKTMKKTTRNTARKGKSRPGKFGRTIYEKTYNKNVGKKGNGRPTNRVRVIKGKNGDIITSFPY